MKFLESIIVSNERVAKICSAEYRATWKVGDRLIMFGSSRSRPEGTRIILGKVPSHVMTISKIQGNVVYVRSDGDTRTTHVLQLQPIGRKYWMPEHGSTSAAYVVRVEDLSDEEKLFITTRRIQS